MTATTSPPVSSPGAVKPGAKGVGKDPGVDGSAYEIIKARLEEHGKTLGAKVEALNAKRLEVFGGTELAVLANERVRTENNCVPRDIINVGGKLLFAYNVFIGLKKETNVSDVFAVHHFAKNADGTWNLEPVAGDDPAAAFLRDERFVKDFTELYRYYRDATLLQMRLLDSGKMLAVFKTGPTLRDLKVLRWAVDRQGHIRYVDNLGLDDHTFPTTHSFEWRRATREDYVTGRFPHVNVLDSVFVETTGGDLTIKIENNTSTGKGIYSEPVEDKNQSLDDAQFLYARCGALVLLRVLPYRETAWRHFVFNSRTKEAHRVDAIEASCVELPEDHGVIFPGGYALATGEVKTFDGVDTKGLSYEWVDRSPNGEDVLYSFYNTQTGHGVLLSYNLINKEVATPIHQHGSCIFADGTMIAFRAESEEPTRVHPMRIWQTPFFSDEFAATQRAADGQQGSLLAKAGNPEAVRAISDAHTLRRMIASQKPSVTLYEDMVAHATRTLDTYPWLAHADAGNLAASIIEVKNTAELVIDEFEKVLSIQKASAEALAKAEDEQRKIFGDVRPDSFTSIDPFVELMKRLQQQRGRLITLKEERYIDTARLDLLAAEAKRTFDELTERAGKFLQTEGALAPYLQKHDEIVKATETIAQAHEGKPLIEELERVQSGLKLLTEVTGQLKIDDAAARTKILEDIADVISQLNRARAVLEGRRKDLLRTEGTAEFGAQVKLVAQAVESALSMCDTPERCDQELARLLVQIEELEGRFAEFEPFLEELTKKREETFELISARKQRLLDDRSRRAANLLASADRILEGVKRRALAMKSLDELNAAFAANPMIEKVRAVAEELQALGDSVKADEVLSKLKSARAEAQRQVRDKSELFVDGDDILSLGKHKFTVNRQAVDLTMLPRPKADGTTGLALHITGTGYFEDVDDPELASFADLVDAALPSEDPTIARAEYLAGTIFLDAQAGRGGLSLAALEDARKETTGGEDALLKIVGEIARARYDEGYDRGVHDADATRILHALVALARQAGLLRFSPRARALALLFFAADRSAKLVAQAQSAARMSRVFGNAPSAARVVDEIASRVAHWAFVDSRIGAVLSLDAVRDASVATEAARYLVEECASGPPSFALSGEAKRLLDELRGALAKSDGADQLDRDLEALAGHPSEQLGLALAWASALAETHPALAPNVPEAAAALVVKDVPRAGTSALGSVVVDGLISQHARIERGQLTVRLDEYLVRVRQFVDVRKPRFDRFKQRRSEVIDEAKRRLKLSEIVPRVLSSFVRNKLVNDVYLPLVGDNLAKQMGAAGDKKRTDLMGLLLLVSPPGYGKTTLMEYVASRLGLVYVKSNGPALGHDTKSLDPSEAPNATARAEVEKINFAFEMGNNVLLLLDDIQHTHPELLQKFISLCDGTRRVEGVWKGKTRTYDMRGKKLVVCMAGNPYTETGDKFRIPDMLANRADTYNLGDILGGKLDAFALSYVENALTSNQVLAPLATRDPADIYLLIKMAQGEEVPTTDLKHTYAGAEIDEIVRVLKKLLHVQKTLLKVNAQYIASAATDERFRTEPAFKLQGSYRNMNKLAEKIVAVMNDAELERLVDDHYRSEAQTLTTGAEHNLLKLAELRGTISPEQSARWEEIKRGFARAQMGGDASADPATRVTNTIASLAQRLDGISTGIGAAIESAAKTARPDSQAPLVEHLASQLGAQLAALKNSVDSAAKSTRPEGNAALIAELQQLRAIVHAQHELDKSRPPPKPAPAPVDKGPPRADPALLEKVDAVIEALHAAKIDVRLEAPAPAGINELVRLQTIMIEASLVPLIKGLTSSIAHEKDNASRLEQALAAIKALDEKGLPASQPAQVEVYRPFKPKIEGTRTEDD